MRRILKDAGATAILVTHDQDEALSLADKVAVIREGCISQCDAPATLYAQPATPDLAREFGNVNFLKGVARGPDVETDIGRFALEDVASLDARWHATARAHSSRADRAQRPRLGPRARARYRVLRTRRRGQSARSAGELVLHARTSHAIDLPARDSDVGLSVRGAVVAWKAAAPTVS